MKANRRGEASPQSDCRGVASVGEKGEGKEEGETEGEREGERKTARELGGLQ